MYIQKHVSSELAWDELTHIATAAYNFCPKCAFKSKYIFPHVWTRCVYTASATVKSKIEIYG